MEKADFLTTDWAADKKMLKKLMADRHLVLTGNMERGHYALAAHNARQIHALLKLAAEHEAGEFILPHKEATP